jgi:hypothetical protein
MERRFGDSFWNETAFSRLACDRQSRGPQMIRIIDVAAALPRREFVMGSLFGITFTIACIAGLSRFGFFPKESEGLILSADYRLSRTEMQLREEVRYLEHELDLLRRARTNTASYPGDTRS